jgi:hypothetical protein
MDRGARALDFFGQRRVYEAAIFIEMKILIWPGHHDALDFAIKLCTHGRGSHAAFLRDDNATVHEAFWPKVRDRDLTERDAELAEVYEIHGISARGHQEFEHLFDCNVKADIRYSYADLFRYAFNLPNRDEYHTFCSRYVFHCLNAILFGDELPLTRVECGDWVSPRDLRISPVLKLKKNFFKK